MAMKRLLLTLILLGASLLIFAQDYPFSVVKSGTGKQAVVFIPGFACSGDVWAETVSVLEDSYTCYVLTMAGFSGVAPEECPSFRKVENADCKVYQRGADRETYSCGA